MPASQESNLCLFDLPNDPDPTKCRSAGKLIDDDSSPHKYFRSILRRPEENVLEHSSKYATAAFWRYVQEQFSYPITAPANDAHPSGEASAIPRPHLDVACGNCEHDARPSDEGIDFMGLLMQGFAEAPVLATTYGVMDATLHSKLGRHRSDVVFDFHTTLYLKDYNLAKGPLGEVDPRWNFDWVGSYNLGTLLEGSKPFVVPADLYGKTKGTSGLPSDLLTRAFRTLDSEGTCVPDPGASFPDCTKSPWTVAFGQGIQSYAPTTLDAWGTTALSVRPDPAWIGHGMPVQIVAQSGPLPRVRIFRIQASGSSRTPRPFCMPGPGYECKAIKTYGLELVNKVVPIEADTDEVLVILSAKAKASAFTWRIGTPAPALQIVEPTASLRELIGHPAAQHGRQPFLARLAVVGGPPLSSLDKHEVHVRIKDGANVLCELDPGGVPNGWGLPDPGDFTLMPLSGGNMFIVATPREDCYPSWMPLPGAPLDLEVSIDGIAPAVQVGALWTSLSPFRQATTLVLDHSAGMDGWKLDAIKFLSKAIMESMVAPPGSEPTHDLGLVMFRSCGEYLTGMDAMTPSVKSSAGLLIGGITASDATSIGDGVFEAQSLLATAYDPVNPLDRPDRQAMIVLSGSKNDQQNDPYDYYAGSEPDQPNLESGGVSCGNWYEGPLSRDARSAASPPLPLPVVSVIAIGGDADLVELNSLAKFSGGTTLLYIPTLAVPPFVNPTDIGDRFAAAFNDVSRYDRTRSARAYGMDPAQIPPLPVEPGATELRVSLVSGTEPTQYAKLLSPGGTLHDPSSVMESGQAAVFRILSPEPGMWAVMSPVVTTTQEPSVFVEAAVRSRVVMVVTADVASALPLSSSPPYESGRFVGSDVFLRAAPYEDAPMLGCTVQATITRPQSGVIDTVDLSDDGSHDDGLASDGVYGFRYAKTGELGAYDVLVHSICVSVMSAATVFREKRTAFELHGEDVDEDGMGDHWEVSHGLDRWNPSDAVEDSDGDGLANLDELVNGLDPHLDDTDGGGESDASELGAGRDPRDPSDDALQEPSITLLPGRSMVVIGLGMRTDGVPVQIDYGPSASGPFERLTDYAGYGYPFWPHGSVQEDTPVCYRARAMAFGMVSGWSAPRCTLPRADPHPPYADLAKVAVDVPGRDVVFEVELRDDPRESDLFPYDVGTEASGVAEMRFSKRMGFTGAAWHPVSAPATEYDSSSDVLLEWDPSERTLRAHLGGVDETAVWVEVRDEAGNSSGPLSAIASIGAQP